MAVTVDDVRHVATLARLGLSEDRLQALVAQLNTILVHMDVLSKVDTEGVAEAIGIGAAGVRLHADVGPALRMEILPERFAPEMRDNLFLVPRLATHENADGS